MPPTFFRDRAWVRSPIVMLSSQQLRVRNHHHPLSTNPPQTPHLQPTAYNPTPDKRTQNTHCHVTRDDTKCEHTTSCTPLSTRIEHDEEHDNKIGTHEVVHATTLTVEFPPNDTHPHLLQTHLLPFATRYRHPRSAPSRNIATSTMKSAMNAYSCSSSLTLSSCRPAHQ